MNRSQTHHPSHRAFSPHSIISQDSDDYQPLPEDDATCLPSPPTFLQNTTSLVQLDRIDMLDTDEHVSASLKVRQQTMAAPRTCKNIASIPIGPRIIQIAEGLNERSNSINATSRRVGWPRQKPIKLTSAAQLVSKLAGGTNIVQINGVSYALSLDDEIDNVSLDVSKRVLTEPTQSERKFLDSASDKRCENIKVSQLDSHESAPNTLTTPNQVRERQPQSAFSRGSVEIKTNFEDVEIQNKSPLASTMIRRQPSSNTRAPSVVSAGPPEEETKEGTGGQASKPAQTLLLPQKYSSDSGSMFNRQAISSQKPTGEKEVGFEIKADLEAPPATTATGEVVQVQAKKKKKGPRVKVKVKMPVKKVAPQTLDATKELATSQEASKGPQQSATKPALSSAQKTPCVPASLQKGLSSTKVKINICPKTRRPKADKNNSQTDQVKNITLEDIQANRYQHQLCRTNSSDNMLHFYLQNRKFMFAENQKLRNKLQMQKVEDQSRLHIGFLHASPVTYEAQTKIQKIPPLNFNLEENAIKHAIRRSGQEVIYKRAVATKVNFIEFLRSQPFILHLSCHGYDNQHVRDQREQLQQPYLLFEDELGRGDPINQDQLKILLIQQMQKIEVILVAACMSQFTERFFKKSGAKHVICVESGKQILDSVAILFTKSFYIYLVNGQSVCAAFYNAKRDVGFEIDSNEANILKLFVNQEDDDGEYNEVEHNKETCKSIWPLKQGILKCTSSHIQVKHMPSKIQNFYERETSMSDLVRTLLESDQILNMIGLPGIGKSLLARNTLHYLRERQYFCRGIISISVCSVSTVPELLAKLKNVLMDKIQMDESGEQRMRQKTKNSEEAMQFITKFFRQDYHGFQLKKTKTFNQGGKFLLCLDKCQLLVSQDKKAFVDFLQKLSDDCQHLKIMMTSRADNIMMPQNPSLMQVYILPQMHRKQSVRLFLKQIESKTTTLSDVIDLIASQDGYPLQDIIPNYKKTSLEMQTQKALDSHFKGASINSRIVVEALAKTELFKLLSGNPLSVSFVAKCYTMPDNKLDSLKDLWELVKIQQDENDFDGNNNLCKHLNNVSLENSIGLTIGLLSSESIKVLNFLSFMPAGATIYQLQKITEMESEDVKKQIDTLRQMVLVNFDRVNKRYILASTILKEYLHRVVSYHEPINTLIKYYIVEVKLLYKSLFTKVEQENLCVLDAEWLKSHPLMSMNQKPKSLHQKLLYQLSSTNSHEQTALSQPMHLSKKGNNSKMQHADFINISYAVSKVNKMIQEKRENAAQGEVKLVKKQPTVKRESFLLKNASKTLVSKKTLRRYYHRTESKDESDLAVKQLPDLLKKSQSTKIVNATMPKESSSSSARNETGVPRKMTGGVKSILMQKIGTSLMKRYPKIQELLAARFKMNMQNPILDLEEGEGFDSDEDYSISKIAPESSPISVMTLDMLPKQESLIHSAMSQLIKKYISEQDQMKQDCQAAADDFMKSTFDTNRESVKKIKQALAKKTARRSTSTEQEDESNSSSSEEIRDEYSDNLRDDDKEMTDHQEFILMFQAVQVLSRQINIEEIEIDQVIEGQNLEESSPFFFGNIFRVQALLSEQKFQERKDKADQDDDEDQDSNQLLVEAVSGAEMSLQMFKRIASEQANGLKCGVYGQALANYLLGSLHFKYADRLNQLVLQNEENSTLNLHDDSLNKAKNFMKQAAKEFRDAGHLKGVQIAYKQLAKMFEGEDDEIIQELKSKHADAKATYHEYISANGTNDMVYNPRQSMDELSLLTEIVRSDEKKKQLFAPCYSRIKTKGSTNSFNFNALASSKSTGQRAKSTYLASNKINKKFSQI